MSAADLASLPEVRCGTCGTPYVWSRARYCIECKTFRNPVRQWLTNFNASGWTAFIAVAGLTATTAAGLYNSFTDNVDIHASACRGRQLVATVVNGESRGVILTNPRADIVYRTASGPKRQPIGPGSILLGPKPPLPEGEHLDSDFVPPLGRAYMSLWLKDGEFPLLPPHEAGSCQVRFSIAYTYGPLGKRQQRDIGDCPCGVIMG